MKRKELKDLALKIAKLENKRKKVVNKTEQKEIENEIFDLMQLTDSIDDLFVIDELIQTKFKYIVDK